MEFHNPSDLPPPRGFSHVSVAGPGRLITVAGQVGQASDGNYPESLVDQFRFACENVAKALAAAGATPQSVISLQIFTTDVDGYRESLRSIGEAYRATFSDHYPPMALLGVSRLFDKEAQVELLATAFLETESG